MKKCPRCKKDAMNDLQVRNALSRRDNKTYICRQCGEEEVLIDTGFQKADDIEISFVAKVKS